MKCERSKLLMKDRDLELSIDSKDDGVWLHFKVGGLYSSVNLPMHFGGRKGIVDHTIQEWCETYALFCKKTPATGKETDDAR